MGFLKKYWYIVIALLLLLVGTYLWFIAKGIFPIGDNLQKSDWLAFWGGFLSFSGSVLLGAISIWQNNQANDVNKRSIAENRRKYQIELENRLIRDKYATIISEIQLIFQQVCDLNNAINSISGLKNINDLKKAFDTAILYAKQLEEMEIDKLISLCYEQELAETSMIRGNIKESLHSIAEHLRNTKEFEERFGWLNWDLGQYIGPVDDIATIKNELLYLNSYFVGKINAVSTYSSFDEELPRDDKPAT